MFASKSKVEGLLPGLGHGYPLIGSSICNLDFNIFTEIKVTNVIYILEINDLLRKNVDFLIKRALLK